MEVIIKYPGDDALKGVPTPTEVISESESVKSGNPLSQVVSVMLSQGTNLVEILDSDSANLDKFPIDVLWLIINNSQSLYYKISLVCRDFGIVMDKPIRDRFRISFGYEYVQHVDPYNNGNDRIELRKDGMKHGILCPSYRTKYGECWFQFDKMHRDGGPAKSFMEEFTWYQHGEISRHNGPAIISGDRIEWRMNGDRSITCDEEKICFYVLEKLFETYVLHNDKGPAVIYYDGSVEKWTFGRQRDLARPYSLAQGLKFLETLEKKLKIEVNKIIK